MKTETELNKLEEILLNLEVHASHIRSGAIENDWGCEDWERYRRLRNTYVHYQRYKDMNEQREKKENKIKLRYKNGK